MNIKKIVPLFLIAASPSAAYAQANDPALLRAHAAGYKAQFICSGLWNAGRTVAQIEADDLTGIYAEIATIVPTLKAEVDQGARRVTVRFADNMPPRIAHHNPITGCTGMPIGWRLNQGQTQHQYADLERAAPGSLDAQPWPMGNAKAKTDKPLPALQAAVDRAFAATAKGKTSGVLIVRNGKIIAEIYREGHDQTTSVRTWSVAKSITATYAGFIKQKIGDRWRKLEDEEPGATDPRQQISIDNLLRMSSGLMSDTAGNRTDSVYMGGAVVDEWTTKWPMLHPPGTQFRYANYDTLAAMLMLRRIEPDAHPHMLFDKLGMTRTFAETDWKGHYVLSSQVWTTARDLARLGLLYLANGKWNGEQLLPADWRAYVTTPSGPQPAGDFGYGASFWLMNKTAGVPNDAFAAFGNRGQYLVIVPSLKLVIVRQGYDDAQSRFDIADFTKTVVAAVKPK
jgi:CubicO group peptidase (beta-lactamase class C family)